MAGPWSSRASLAVNLALSLAVTVLFLGAAELLARRFEKPRLPLDPADRTMDWEKDWGGDFYVLRSASPGWPPTDDFTHDGVRDFPHAPEKPAGVHRVLCLGDSVTFGYGLRRDQSYPAVLQKHLDGRGPGIEVLNVSLMAWSTRQERIAYERIARPYRPDLVLLGVCLNDPQELANNLARPPALLARLHERSALVRRIVDAQGREIRNVQELFTAPQAPEVRASLERFFDALRQLKAVVQADGVPLSVLVFPFAGQVGPDPPSPVVQEKIRAFCAREALPFLDVLPGLRSLGPAAFLPGDHLHLTAEACARVADQVVEAALVPPAWTSVTALAQALGTDALKLEPARVKDLAPLLAHRDPAVRAEAAWAAWAPRPGPRCRLSCADSRTPRRACGSTPRLPWAGSEAPRPGPPSSPPSRIPGRGCGGGPPRRSTSSASTPGTTSRRSSSPWATATSMCVPSPPGASGRWAPRPARPRGRWPPSRSKPTPGYGGWWPPRSVTSGLPSRKRSRPSATVCGTPPGRSAGAPPAPSDSSAPARCRRCRT